MEWRNKKMKNLRDIIPDASNWKKTGRQMGSNPGGVYKDESGKEFYMKQSKSDDHAKNENLANHLYRHLGVPVPDTKLITHSNGKLGTASSIMHIKPFDPHNKNHVQEIGKHFAAHAFVANWDAVGLANDNQVLGPKGMTTIDAGGSLNYRAQGSPKGNAFGHKATEWDSLRDTSRPNPATHIFSQMQPHEIVNSAKAVANLKNDTIHDLVHEHGPGSEMDKHEMTQKLINRKQDIIERANDLSKKHKLEPIRNVDDEEA